MSDIKRSVKLAKRHPELRSLIKKTHDEIHDWYGIDLTTEQIVLIYNEHPSLYTSAFDSNFNAISRETFIDTICQKLLNISWPTFGEINQYPGGEDKFFIDLKQKAKEYGYTINTE